MASTLAMYSGAFLFLLCHAYTTVASTASLAELPKVEKDPTLETAQSCLANLESSHGSCKAPNASRSTSAPSDAVPLQCGLFLAQSSIPNAGWGMYAGVDIKDGDVIPPVDVVIPVIDSEANMKMMKHYKRLELTMGSAIAAVTEKTGFKTSPYFRNSTAIKNLPKWLMEQYYWDCGMTHNYYDAEKIDSVIPGLGMLANSHPGMILAENMGPARPAVLGGRMNGARSPYQDQSFIALKNMVAGHEIFVEYGDSWFKERFNKSFGLSNNYKKGNSIVQKWQLSILDRYYEKYSHLQDMWKDLNELVMAVLEPWNARTHEVVGRLDLLDTSRRFVASENPTAYASCPTAINSVEWLQNEGLCLDHITVADSIVAPGEKGAFASRNLPKGTIIAPAPVVHMSRDHLAMLLLDHVDSDIVLWKGHQLLLNYVYGHPESSLLFFPYAPAVNLINHFGGSKGNKEGRPNAKLQWSSRMPRREWLESWTPEQIVGEEYKAGLVMEIIALEDIATGDEILLDYGNDWQEAWEEHKATVPPPPELESIDWNRPSLLTINDDQRYPSFVQTVCWIHEEQRPNYFFDLSEKDKSYKFPDQWLKWKEVDTAYLSDTLLCTIVGRQTDGAYYNVVLKEYFETKKKREVEVEVRIEHIPRKAVTVVPDLYTSDELRRDSFRHEIGLPEEMVPEHWRDLKVVEKEEHNAQCNLYMAESSIKNAGLGVYRGYARQINPHAAEEIENFCEDMVIQVEDFEVNQMLRRRYLKQSPDPDTDEWLLSQYALPGHLTMGGNLEAGEVQSLTPGCGMLANTHQVLYNSFRLPPIRLPNNTTDPSLGATTPYHNAQFLEQYIKHGKKKVRPMTNGGEVFVKTSDNWFLNRVDIIGEVPLRSDYFAIDKVLVRFQKLRSDHGEEAAGILWMLLWNTLEAFEIKRIAAGVPRDMNDIPDVLAKGGIAKRELSDRVRTQEWLEANGSCIDNIRPGTSTVRLAENGAFATRRLSKDSSVAPMPMIHVSRQHMDVYNSDDISDPEGPVFLEGKQLVLNYCYGHPESSILLFPYSPVVNYINHAPSVSKDGEAVANAKLQWSSRFNTNEWLEKSPDELLRHHKHAGLVMELVATREISQGEEILIDYGAEWANAWQNHKENWNLNKLWKYEPPRNDWLDWMPTELEIGMQNMHVQFDDPGKFLGCHVQRPQQKLEPVDEKLGETLLEFEWKHAEGMFRTTTHIYACEIIRRNIDSKDISYAMIRKETVSPLRALYNAVVTVDFGDDMRPPLRFISYNMPRRAIEIFDDEYVAPQFYRGAFRHEIGISDDIFPEAWRDLKL